MEFAVNPSTALISTMMSLVGLGCLPAFSVNAGIADKNGSLRQLAAGQQRS
jgi:hypothetical protein